MSEPEETQQEEAPETPEATGAEVEVEELGPCKRRLTVRVPKETVEREITKSFEELATKAIVPGFRRGRAPKRLLETRFGEAVQDQVKEELISRSYQEALEEHEFEPVSTPDVDDVEFDPEKELSYQVALEIKPIFEVDDYEGLALEEPPTEPTGEEVEEFLEGLRQREGHYETVEGAVFGEGSLAVADCLVTIDGETYREEKQTDLVMGPGNWLRTISDDVAEPLIGKTSGDEVSFSTVVRPDFANEDLQGKVAEIKVKFYEIKELQVPDLDDEFAQGLGAEDIENLRKGIRTELVRQKEAVARAALREQVREKLLEKFDFELPEDHLREHAEHILRRQRLDLRYRGLPEEEIDKHTDRLEEASRKQAERDLKLEVILEKIAEKERIYATENDVEQEVAALAEEYRVRPARMRAGLERRRMLAGLRVRVREEKTIDHLLSKAEVTKALRADEPESDQAETQPAQSADQPGAGPAEKTQEE